MMGYIFAFILGYMFGCGKVTIADLEAMRNNFFVTRPVDDEHPFEENPQGVPQKKFWEIWKT